MSDKRKNEPKIPDMCKTLLPSVTLLRIAEVCRFLQQTREKIGLSYRSLSFRIFEMQLTSTIPAPETICRLLNTKRSVLLPTFFEIIAALNVKVTFTNDLGEEFVLEPMPASPEEFKVVKEALRERGREFPPTQMKGKDFITEMGAEIDLLENDEDLIEDFKM